MNFVDTYDITRSATPNAEQPQNEQASLNDEVNQVIGQFGRFWGGFRKQSQQALESARKDFSDVVVQAQKGLSKLTVAGETTLEAKEDGEAPVNPSDEAGPSNTVEASTPTTRETSTEGSSSQSFFSRLQASLPPTVVATVATVQSNIPESIKHASENIDFAQIRSNIVSDFHRVQDVTRAQAEDYFQKSEALLREAVKEAGEALRDAVKVVPPEEASRSSAPVGMLWDGTDSWMFPYDGGSPTGASGSSTQPQLQTAASVATRAEALLKRLKHDPTILRIDPEAEDISKSAFTYWQEKEVNTKEGGIEGEEWSTRIAVALDDSADGQALRQLEEMLVPDEMTRSVFWLRFFFRSHQIREEEQKRKALLRSTSETEEEFSWEDDEEESSPTMAGALSVEASEKTGVPPTEGLLRPDVSRRVNSSDSFDLVSAASASASVSVVGDGEKVSKPKPEGEGEEGEEEDGDSDWE